MVTILIRLKLCLPFGRQRANNKLEYVIKMSAFSSFQLWVDSLTIRYGDLQMVNSFMKASLPVLLPSNSGTQGDLRQLIQGNCTPTKKILGINDSQILAWIFPLGAICLIWICYQRLPWILKFWEIILEFPHGLSIVYLEVCEEGLLSHHMLRKVGHPLHCLRRKRTHRQGPAIWLCFKNPTCAR